MLGADRRPNPRALGYRDRSALEAGREDKSTVRRGNAPRVMASLRNIAFTILRLEGEANIAKATRGARNYPHRALKFVGLTIT